MTALRTTLALLGSLAFGYAAVALWLLPWLTFGVALAICAACVIGLELCRAIEKDRERARDREVWRDYRAAVWERRIAEAQAARPELTIIKGGNELILCLHPGPTEPYICALNEGHDGPHKAFRRNAQNYPGCVWGGVDELRA